MSFFFFFKFSSNRSEIIGRVVVNVQHSSGHVSGVVLHLLTGQRYVNTVVIYDNIVNMGMEGIPVVNSQEIENASIHEGVSRNDGVPENENANLNISSQNCSGVLSQEYVEVISRNDIETCGNIVGYVPDILNTEPQEYVDAVTKEDIDSAFAKYDHFDVAKLMNSADILADVSINPEVAVEDIPDPKASFRNDIRVSKGMVFCFILKFSVYDVFYVYNSENNPSNS